MAKNHLLLDEDDLGEAYTYGLQLSSLAEYLWVFRLNQKLDYQFVRSYDIPFHKNDISFLFTHYSYSMVDEFNELKIISNFSLPTVLENQGNSLFPEEEIHEYLLPQKKQFSHIIFSNSPLSDDILLHLRSDSNVLRIQELGNKETEVIQNLIA